MQNMNSNATVDHNTIAHTAKGLWEKAGRPAGRDLEFWLSAESQLRIGNQATVQSTVTAEGKPTMGADWVSPTLAKERKKGPGGNDSPAPIRPATAMGKPQNSIRQH